MSIEVLKYVTFQIKFEFILCFLFKGSKSGGRTPEPLGGVGDQAYTKRTTDIYLKNMDFLDLDENQDMDALRYFSKLALRTFLTKNPGKAFKIFCRYQIILSIF